METVRVRYRSDDGKPPSFIMKFGIGMAAGGCGAFVGTPAEVALIRMTADGRLPVAERRNYKNVVDALARIVREEGVVTLWRGAVPTIARAMVVNSAQLATYSQVIYFHKIKSHHSKNAHSTIKNIILHNRLMFDSV